MNPEETPTPEGDEPTDEEQVQYVLAQPNSGQSTEKDLEVPDHIPQPTQDPEVIIPSDDDVE